MHAPTLKKAVLRFELRLTEFSKPKLLKICRDNHYTIQPFDWMTSTHDIYVFSFPQHKTGPHIDHASFYFHFVVD